MSTWLRKISTTYTTTDLADADDPNHLLGQIHRRAREGNRQKQQKQQDKRNFSFLCWWEISSNTQNAAQPGRLDVETSVIVTVISKALVAWLCVYIHRSNQWHCSFLLVVLRELLFLLLWFYLVDHNWFSDAHFIFNIFKREKVIFKYLEIGISYPEPRTCSSCSTFLRKLDILLAVCSLCSANLAVESR